MEDVVGRNLRGTFGEESNLILKFKAIHVKLKILKNFD